MSNQWVNRSALPAIPAIPSFLPPPSTPASLIPAAASDPDAPTAASVYHLVSQVRATVISSQFSDLLCISCGLKIGVKERFYAVIEEDPTQSIPPVDPTDPVYAETFGQPMPTETPTVPNDLRWIVVCHLNKDCKDKVRHARSAQMFNRVLVPATIRAREGDLRMTIPEYLAMYHSTKLDVVRAYPDCDRLVVDCVAADHLATAHSALPLLDEYLNSNVPLDLPLAPAFTLSTMVIMMPLQAADVLTVRHSAWTQSESWGLFQKISFIDLVVNDRHVTPAAQIQRMQQAAASIFKPTDKNMMTASSKVLASLLAHRVPNTNTQDAYSTKWRICVRVELSQREFDKAWAVFYENFLHPDAVFDPFMTFTQLFANEVLQTSEIAERAMLANPAYLKGGRSIRKEELKRAWLIEIRDKNWKLLDDMTNLLAAQFKAMVSSNCDKVHERYVNSQLVVPDETPGAPPGQNTFVYRVNAQQVATRVNLQAPEHYYCLPMAANDLRCYQYQPKVVEPPNVIKHIPILYSDVDLHERDMRTLEMVRVPLDSLTMIYHQSTEVMDQFNRLQQQSQQAPQPQLG